MNSYKVGDVVPQLKTGGNYIQIGYGDGLWELRMGYPAITPKEIQETLYFHGFQGWAGLGYHKNQKPCISTGF